MDAKVHIGTISQGTLLDEDERRNQTENAVRAFEKALLELLSAMTAGVSEDESASILDEAYDSLIEELLQMQDVLNQATLYDMPRTVADYLSNKATPALDQMLGGADQSRGPPSLFYETMIADHKLFDDWLQSDFEHVC